MLSFVAILSISLQMGRTDRRRVTERLEGHSEHCGVYNCFTRASSMCLSSQLLSFVLELLIRSGCGLLLPRGILCVCRLTRLWRIISSRGYLAASTSQLGAFHVDACHLPTPTDRERHLHALCVRSIAHTLPSPDV